MIIRTQIKIVKKKQNFFQKTIGPSILNKKYLKIEINARIINGKEITFPSIKYIVYSKKSYNI